MKRGIVALAALLGAASPAQGQVETPPDPATLTLPDMTPTRDPEVIEDGWKFFYFHRAGVSYAQAYADFRTCYGFLPALGPYELGRPLPMFVPWGETPGVTVVEPTSNWGLVGVAIIALTAGPFERRARMARMRRCMEPRGYLRYPLAEAAWRQLTDDFSERSIALQALAASGPAPDLTPVTR